MPVLKTAKLQCALFLVLAVAGSSVALRAQDNTRPLPEVIEHRDPMYPPLARPARIQGQVVLRLTTNGHVATDVTVVTGHPLLVQSALENARQWKFADHVPGTFEVTFKYAASEIRGRFLQEPGKV
jgi:outer membrane biosynthesis protein TonB